MGRDKGYQVVTELGDRQAGEWGSRPGGRLAGLGARACGEIQAGPTSRDSDHGG